MTILWTVSVGISAGDAGKADNSGAIHGMRYAKLEYRNDNRKEARNGLNCFALLDICRHDPFVFNSSKRTMFLT